MKVLVVLDLLFSPKYPFQMSEMAKNSKPLFYFFIKSLNPKGLEIRPNLFGFRNMGRECHQLRDRMLVLECCELWSWLTFWSNAFSNIGSFWRVSGMLGIVGRFTIPIICLCVHFCHVCLCSIWVLMEVFETNKWRKIDEENLLKTVFGNFDTQKNKARLD